VHANGHLSGPERARLIPVPDPASDTDSPVTAEAILGQLAAQHGGRVALAGEHDASPDRGHSAGQDAGHPAGQGVGPGPSIVLTRASAIPMRPVVWAWAERIPAGALTVIPGREGIGKSLLLAWLTAQVTRGHLPGQFHGQPRPVIYAASEDSWSHTIGPRLYAAGADLDMVYRVDVRLADALDQLTLPRDCDALAHEIRRLGVALLAADPLLSLIHAGIDTHRDRDLRTALEPLTRMADQTGCAVVGLAHFNKSTSPDALNLITGSRAFSAVARAVLAIARDDNAEDGSCVMSQAKNNLGRLDLPSLRYRIDSTDVPTHDGATTQVGRLHFTGESGRSVSDILSDGASEADTREERDATAAWLRDYLTAQGGQAPTADILKAARAEGIAERTLHRARARLGLTRERFGFPARAVWSLPAEHTTCSHPPQSGQFCQFCQDTGAGRTGRTGAEQPDQPTTDHAEHTQLALDPASPTGQPRQETP
jgi:hypothetical protein